MSRAKVVPIRHGAQEVEQADHERPLKTKEPEQPYCRHRRTELAKTARKVMCRDCGEEVDAFTVLAGLAEDTERYLAHWRHARDGCRAAEARLRELKREERNAKARLRAARKKIERLG